MEVNQTEVIGAAPTEQVNTKLATSIPPQKYISMFRIDGVPILPPLMTPEKRRQMQKLKEKAVKVEQCLEESRRRGQRFSIQQNTAAKELNGESEEVFNNHESSCSSSVSEHVLELDTQQQEVDESYTLLSNLLTQHKSEVKSVIPVQSVCLNKQTSADDPNLDVGGSSSSGTNLLERMQKLQKSETMIYDHRSNTLISPLPEADTKLIQQEPQQINLDRPDDKHIGCKVELREVEESANLNYLTHQKSITNCMDKIPSICIDPPTPLTGICTFGGPLGPRSSVDTIDANEQGTATKIANKSFQDDTSSDESFNCMASTANIGRDLKTRRRVTNITSKILKFENFAVPGTPRCSSVKPPQRSVTSPSLKPPFVDRSPNKNKSELNRSGPKFESGLVRSNSFTLDYPSKALIEHIRQQKVLPGDNYPTKRSNLFSTSAMRDTVESKAKRVQKVDLRTNSLPMRLQMKASTTNITNSPQSYPTSNSMTLKPKRSPYDAKIVKPKISRQLKKSVSGTSAIKLMKARPSMPSIHSPKQPADSPRLQSTSGSQYYNEIEVEHRKKFLELLAQQKQEQQRMQQVFEEQQQYLLEQLTAKIDSVQLQQALGNGGKKPICGYVGGGRQRSVDNSPTAKSECSEMQPLHSPTISMNSSAASHTMCGTSSGACDLPSLELSASSSAIPATSLSSNRCTPRRRLFSADQSVSGRSASICNNSGNMNNNVGTTNTPTPGLINRRHSTEAEAEGEVKRRTAAVTKINAYVRGYLVRRLFQAEQIQRIVQTIQDTLIFVLNLHMDTAHNPSEANAPANIQLKARLLKQLSSAMRTLHLVFFQTTVKERMDIICRDRKRIKAKIVTMNMKRSPSIRT